VTEHLPSKDKALRSIPSSTNTYNDIYTLKKAKKIIFQMIVDSPGLIKDQNNEF
jgi:hypothetical protein